MTEPSAPRFAAPGSAPVPRPGAASASDEALARAAGAGDEAAFEEIVHRHAPTLLRYARRQLGSHDDAVEVTQEALVSAWQGIDAFEGRSSLRTWLIRLVHRRAVDLVRKRRPVPLDDEALDLVVDATTVREAVRADPLQSYLDAELLADLQDALAELSWQQRSVWLLREVEGLSYDEIAETLGTTSGSVRGLLARARPRLAERMSRWR
ncbi:RNA polymerase sigma factor [Nocardioides acrostichi]|uniref:RNA polymerase sigma factor n=1 Tax=Nocardioides acrostichi TaxID=2784339 RepID=UPI002E2957D4|nr:RNA polymerase sigma factor [Nocardioides acrostichi]